MASRTGSARSNASSTRKYRTKANQSQIDDTLFGPTKSEQVKNKNQSRPLSKEEILHFQTGAPIPRSNIKPKTYKRETVRVITKDLIRDIIVPSEDPIGNTITIGGYKFNNIAKNAFEEHNTEQLIAEEKKQERDRMLAEMAERKKSMRRHDVERKQGEKMNDLEQESATMASELLAKSQAKRLEENDEIKHLNELILEAKCHAIRDAQVQEKTHLKQELESEDTRLDTLMEIDRVNAIKQQEHVEKNRNAQRVRGAKQIMDQIEANSLEKMLATERREQEAKLLVENQRKLQMLDLDEIETKKIGQKTLQREIDGINSEHKRQKAIRLEQEQLADLRVVKYQEEKAKREAEAEKELIELRRQKELEIAKLRAAQERASDLQAEKDALRAKRHEEATEREYRRKLREEQAKKLCMESEMQEAREEQIGAKRHLMAVQAARERAEFDKSLLEQQKEVSKIHDKDEKKKMAQLQYSDDIRNQIHDRESERIESRKQFFTETQDLEEEIDAKNKQLEHVKQRKLAELRDSGVPEKYVLEVARRIGLIH